MADHRRWYRITLKEPLILSRRNTTTGEHRTLDFIPGRVLLGLTARIYDRLGDDAWTAFHSGAVRFIDAVPETEGPAQALPTPRCLTTLKRRRQRTSEKAYNEAVSDNSAIDDDKQYTSLGAPYVDIEEGALTPITVEKTSTVKTAIDPERGGTARDEHLFGYQAIGRGQTFLARIDADDDVDSSILDALEEVLVGSGRIGRSRSAEFGAVTIERVNGIEERESNAAVGDSSLRVVLTSALALIDDQTGAARLTPEARDFGLPDDWDLDLSNSFIRHRNYDRFNGHRKSFDLKRHVLQRGSVISFESVDGQGLTSEQLDEAKRMMRRGAGVDRQEGLGQFVLEPAWIGEETLQVDRLEQGEDAEAASIEAPDPVLQAFVASRVDRITGEKRHQLYQDAKKLAAFCAKSGDAPGKSQWSRLRRWAKAAPITTEAFGKLAGYEFSNSDETDDENTDFQEKFTKGWEVVFKGKTLGEFVVEYAKNEGDNGRHMLAELAHLVRANLVHHAAKKGHPEEASP